MENTPLHILVVGREPAILEVVERLLNSHEGWQATTAGTEEAAVAAFQQQSFRIVFVGAGFSVQEEETLRQRVKELDPSVTVTRHYGGGSGLLENEVLSILQKK